MTEYEGKIVAYYGMVIDTWVKSRTYFDLSLLAMSFVSIIAIFFIGVSATPLKLAVLSYSLCILMILIMFKMNANYMERLAQDVANPQDKFEQDHRGLRALDVASIIYFAIASVLFLAGMIV